MFDFNKTGPAPTDLATRMDFNGVLAPLPTLIEAANDIERGIEGRRFTNCIIRGPAVIIPNRATRFDDCDLGDVGGDPRNLFLVPAGPMTIGAISVAGCIFTGCLFSGVGLAGDDEFVEAFLKQLVGTRD